MSSTIGISHNSVSQASGQAFSSSVHCISGAASSDPDPSNTMYCNNSHAFLASFLPPVWQSDVHPVVPPNTHRTFNFHSLVITDHHLPFTAAPYCFAGVSRPTPTRAGSPAVTSSALVPKSPLHPPQAQPRSAPTLAASAPLVSPSTAPHSLDVLMTALHANSTATFHLIYDKRKASNPPLTIRMILLDTDL